MPAAPPLPDPDDPDPEEAAPVGTPLTLAAPLKVASAAAIDWMGRLVEAAEAFHVTPGEARKLSIMLTLRT